MPRQSTAPNATCERCGNRFRVVPSKLTTARYCSRECRGRPPITRNCVHCGQTFTRRNRKSDAHRYCSRVCSFADGRGVVPLMKGCEECGAQFRVYPSSPDRFCSTTCSYAHLHKHSAHFQPRQIEIPCAECGKLIKRRKSQLHRSKATYCSKECLGQANGKRKTQNAAPRVPVACDICGTVVMVYPSQAKRRRYCSRQCVGVASQIAMPQVSNLERRVAAELDRLGEHYKTQVPVGYGICDFYLPRRDLYIECDGAYWHGPDFPGVQARDRSKDTYCANRGISLVRLSEDDIRRHLETKLGRVLENYPVTLLPTAYRGSG